MHLGLAGSLDLRGQPSPAELGPEGTPWPLQQISVCRGTGSCRTQCVGTALSEFPHAIKHCQTPPCHPAPGWAHPGHIQLGTAGNSRFLGAAQPSWCCSALGTRFLGASLGASVLLPQCHVVSEELLQRNSFWEQVLFTLKQIFTSLGATQQHNHQNQHGTQDQSVFLYLPTGCSER